MKKLTLIVFLFAFLPMLIVGCNPPPNKNAVKKDSGGICACGVDHGAEGHVDHADHAAETETPAVETSVTETEVPAE